MTPPVDQPLRDVPVVITRARAQADELADRLGALGARIVVFPTIKIVPPEDDSPLFDAVRHLAAYDYLVLTSANGVDALRDVMQQAGVDPATVPAKVCVVGPTTARRMEDVGFRVDVVPDHFHASALIAKIEAMDLPVAGKRFLLPRGDLARPLLAKWLRDAGARVDEADAYRNVPEVPPPDAVEELLALPGRPIVTMTSSSAVDNFVAILGPERLAEFAMRARFVSIGPSTSKTLRDHGLTVDAQADPHSLQGLVDACAGLGDGVRAEGLSS
ncbi:MAG: uroporphyrinogen-III synthase [Deltaproteobacteria bacterium]|nr:uroporphyrinogen-III synthase [Deltaproteobacteria bacterium]